MSKLKLGKDHILEQEIDLAVKSSISTNSDVKLVNMEFEKQLGSFKRDGSYKERFRRCELNGYYGIEIFLFRPKKDADVSILIQNSVGKVSTTKDTFVPTNIAKVIKVGRGLEDGAYKEGDLVQLPYADVTGFSPNPKHAMYHQLDDSNYKPILDDVIPPNVYTFVVTLGRNAWLPPQEFDKEDSDISTYYIHPDYLIGKYN